MLIQGDLAVRATVVGHESVTGVILATLRV